jgi:tetratricopeptide (TPR) repeat protein
MADALKAEGNKAFAAKDYDGAIDLFSKALDLDQSNFVVWSNRSAAKAGKRDWDGALADADQVSLILRSMCPTTNQTKITLFSPRAGLAVHQGESNLVKRPGAQRRCIARYAALCRGHRSL